MHEAWMEDVPAMAVARELPQAVTSGKTLIVVGGRNKIMLDTVELYYEDVKQWLTACELPVPLHYITMATFDENLTIVGIRGSRELDESVCLRCKLTDLIYSCSSSLNTANIWEKTKFEIPPKSSLVNFKGRFLSIGVWQKMAELLLALFILTVPILIPGRKYHHFGHLDISALLLFFLTSYT